MAVNAAKGRAMRAFRTMRLSSNVFNVDTNSKAKSLSDLAHTVFIRDHKIKEAVINCGEYSVCINKSINANNTKPKMQPTIQQVSGR